jgi:hypothetical protein
VPQLQEQIAQGQFDDMSSVDGFALSYSGEDRRPKLSFGLLVDGKFKHVVEIVEAYGDSLANSSLLRLLLCFPACTLASTQKSGLRDLVTLLKRTIGSIVSH